MARAIVLKWCAGSGAMPSTHGEWRKARVRWKVIEGDRRDLCRLIGLSRSPERRVAPELPGVGDVACIIGLPIGPHQMGSQMEGPGGSIGADAPILHAWAPHSPPRGVSPLAHPRRKAAGRAHCRSLGPNGVPEPLGRSESGFYEDVLSPGSSAYHGRGGTAAWTQHTKVREQTQACPGYLLRRPAPPVQ